MKPHGICCPTGGRDLSLLTSRTHDVLVVGGGINGAGIARDLALRGLAVALVEKGDFGSGTSSASTKLIHGGLRYLERGDLRLVFESCRERQILQRIAPHLVRPLPFMIPVYRDDPRSLATIRTGLALYDTLAFFRSTRRHRILSPEEALSREPALREEGLLGAALYWDCRMDDARLCLENVLAAREAGAQTLNYLKVVGFLQHEGKICGVRCRDGEEGEEIEIEAQVVVNATGPWLQALCFLAGDRGAKLRPTRGTHLLVPRISHGEEALYLTAGRDDRLFFVIPWGELSLVGTTDVDHPGEPDTVAPGEEEIEYLLAELGRHLREAAPRRCDVVAGFAGLRPLIAASGPRISRISREHRIFESPSGLLSVGGGKYTTYRAVAAEVAGKICKRLKRGEGKSRTGHIPLPGGAGGDASSYLGRHGPRLCAKYGVASSLLPTLFGRYGSRTEVFFENTRGDASLLSPVVPGSALLRGEILYAAQFEMARTPEDLLRRRTPLALEKGRGLRELEAVIELLGECLQTPGEHRRRWRHDYLDRYSHP